MGEYQAWDQIKLFSRTKIEDQTDIESSAAELRSAAATSGAGRSSTGPDTEATAAHLQMLGLAPGATWDEIVDAHARLVSDLTPGPNASHRNVALAEQFLSEVNQAFASLRMQSVA